MQMQTQTPQQQQFNPEDFNNNSDSGLYQEAEKELLKLIIETEDLINRFEHETLRGEYKVMDPSKGEVWVRHDTLSKPIINDIGIAEIKARLSGIVNPKTPISFVNEEDYYKKMFYFDMSVAEMFGKRCDVWDLDIEMAKSIKDAMIEIAETVLSMAKEGFTAINFKTQYAKHDIQRSEGSQTNNEGGKSLFGIKLSR